MAIYHVGLVNPTTGASQTSVDVSTSDAQTVAYLKSFHGKMGFEFAFPSLNVSAATTASLDTLASSARRYGQMMMFVTWDG